MTNKQDKRLSWDELKRENQMAYEQGVKDTKEKVVEELEEMKAEKVSVLNGKIRTDIRKDSRLHNDYGENLCWNGAIDQAIKKINEK